MRALLFVFLGWLLGKTWQRFRNWRSHRKLVGQLKKLGVYGGTVDTRKVPGEPETPVKLSAEPDGPEPFGYKMSWLCIRCGDPERVIAALRPKTRQPANWKTGVQAAYGRQGCFVSPCLDGFVLVIGIIPDAPEDRRELAAQFPEVQSFISHRTIGYYAWKKVVDGRCVREYCYRNVEAEADDGPLTPEETALGFDLLPRKGQEDGERLPNEEDVLNIAAAWGVDPSFRKKVYPPSAGWLCGL